MIVDPFTTAYAAVVRRFGRRELFRTGALLTAFPFLGGRATPAVAAPKAPRK